MNYMNCKGGKVTFDRTAIDGIADLFDVDLNKVRAIKAKYLELPYLAVSWSSGKGATSQDCVSGTLTVESVGSVQGEFAHEQRGKRHFVSHDFLAVIESKGAFEVVAVVFECEI